MFSLVPVVVAKLKLLQILLKMSLRDTGMSTSHRQLEPNPKAFNVVYVRTVTHPLTSTMIYTLVGISNIIRALVRAKLIRV